MGSMSSLHNAIVNDIGNVHYVWCAICLKIEGKEKLLVFKLVSLLKHVGKHKTRVLSHGVEISFWIWILKANMFKMKKSKYIVIQF
jgi:hypothetical protein